MPIFGLGKKKNAPESRPRAARLPESLAADLGSRLGLPTPRRLPHDGDLAVSSLLKFADARDWPGLRAALLTYGHQDQTSLTYKVLKNSSGIDDWLPETLKALPGDAVAMWMLGRYTVDAAWKVRSSKRAQHVSQDQFKQFHAILREAEEYLYASIELDPKSVQPWASLIPSGMGLQVGLDVAQRRFEAAIMRSPGHLGVYQAMLQQLCSKWSGSHERMHEFAAEAVSGPYADMLCVLIPQAYYERFIHLDKDSPERKFIESEASRAELREVAQRTVFRPGYVPNPRNPYAAANMFAWAFCAAGLWAEARAAFAATDGVAVDWGYFSDPVAVYTQRRTLAYRNA